MKKSPFGLGAANSQYDPRTAEYSTLATAPLPRNGGRQYFPEQIQNQHNVGICTSISLTQNAGVALGKKFSADFLYLLQKQIYDGNWNEGSSIFHALKAAKNQGLLEEHLFTHITEQDRLLPYSKYVKKLRAIPFEEVDRLIALCKDKLTGYAFVDISDKELVAKAINDSKAGILCRYEVGSEWWTEPVNPLRKPKKVISGHAVSATVWNYHKAPLHLIANTWGSHWALSGSAEAPYDDYRMTEAWIPYYNHTPEIKPPFKHHFARVMEFGERSEEVEKLQEVLKIEGIFPIAQKITGYYGDITRKAVETFQRKHSVASLSELLFVRGKRVGAKTLQKLNELYNK